MATDQAEISLEDIRYSPENYLEIEVNGTYNINAERELYAEFTITNTILRSDPDHRLLETYYLVYINDTFGYEVPFVISESNLSNYEEAVGETVLRARLSFVDSKHRHW